MFLAPTHSPTAAAAAVAASGSLGTAGKNKTNATQNSCRIPSWYCRCGRHEKHCYFKHRVLWYRHAMYCCFPKHGGRRVGTSELLFRTQRGSFELIHFTAPPCSSLVDEGPECRGGYFMLCTSTHDRRDSCAAYVPSVTQDTTPPGPIFKA